MAVEHIYGVVLVLVLVLVFGTMAVVMIVGLLKGELKP
jgi:hypothetical protein